MPVSVTKDTKWNMLVLLHTRVPPHLHMTVILWDMCEYMCVLASCIYLFICLNSFVQPLHPVQWEREYLEPPAGLCSLLLHRPVQHGVGPPSHRCLQGGLRHLLHQPLLLPGMELPKPKSALKTMFRTALNIWSHAGGLKTTGSCCEPVNSGSRSTLVFSSQCVSQRFNGI